VVLRSLVGVVSLVAGAAVRQEGLRVDAQDGKQVRRRPTRGEG
jgi:hypothetical protein